MTDNEAETYGHKIRKHARTLAELGDVAVWVSEPNAAEWWVIEKSDRLGIVDSHGCADVAGPIARAFVRGFRGSRR